MQLSGTCQIEINSDSKKSLDAKARQKLKQRITEEFSNVLDSILWNEFGIENNEMHACIADDLI